MTSNKTNPRQAETTLPKKGEKWRKIKKNEATGKSVSSFKGNEGRKLEEYEANK